MARNLIWPDYENCIANVPNSILKKFGCETKGKTLQLLDRYLEKDYKNVVTLLLDGMGKCILEKHLSEDGPFRSHLAGIYNSVFLSTTVAATTSALSGMQPVEHSWLGWECYYPQLDKNVTVFLNTIQGTEEPAADFNVARTFTPYEDLVTAIKKNGGEAYGVTPFFQPNPQSIDEICCEIKSLCEKPGKKYIYGYWKEPDGLLHRNGSNSEVVHEELRRMEEIVSELANSLEDTLFIITADHGHIDNEIIHLKDYPKIMDCLVRLPALEPRVLNLFVREGMKETFEKEFTKEFGEKFILMPMEEALEKKLFGTGTPHKCFRGMLGDYLAIAIDDQSIYVTDEEWVSMHGSITEEEVRIPLIVFSNQNR